MNGELQRRFERWRMERFRSQWIEGTLRFAAAAAAALLAALLSDRFFALPRDFRWAIFCAGVLAAGAGVYLYYLRPLRYLAPARIFRDVARRYPQLRAHLQSAWELGLSGPSGHTSGELVREHLRRTDELLGSIPRAAVFPARPSRPAARRTMFAAAAWGVAMPWLYNGQANFQRVLAPWQDVLLDARVEVRPGDRDVAWAEPVDIRAGWRAEHVNGPLVLYARPEGGGWENVPWDREDRDGSSVRIEGLTSVFEYRVGYKDLRTRVYRLTPIPYPHMTGLTVSVLQPGREPTQRALDLEGEGEIAALRRSWVTLRGRPDREIRSARLLVSSLDRPVEMTSAADGFWEGGFPLNDNGSLKVDLLSRQGARDPHPVTYTLRALEDEKPEVALLSPTFELEISRKEKLTVTYDASDDYGLTSLSFLYKVNDGRENIMPLKVFKRAVEQHLGDFDWDLSGLPAGSRVEFRIRATDNAHPLAQTAVSNQGVLHVVDFESVHAQTERLWLGAEETLLRLARQEAEFGERLAETIRDNDSAGDASARERLEQGLKRLALEDASLAKEWADAVRDLQAFARAMRQDPYANPGMTEAAEMLARALDGFRLQDLREAQDAVKAGRFGEAKERHAALESRVRKASEILTAGREMQAMQDFWGETHRMDQAGGEIADEIGRIAKSGKAPSEEQRKKLQKALGQLQAQMDELSKTIKSMPKVDPESAAAQNRKIYHVPLDAARRTADALQAALERGDYEAAARIARQLARQLAQVREAVAKAAQSSAGGEGSMTERMEAAMRLWDDVVEQQSRSLQMVSALEDGKLNEKAEAQKRLLDELAQLQKAVVADAQERAAIVTAPLLASMRKVLEEFEASRVREAPALLASIVESLDFRAQRFPDRAGAPSPEAKALSELAAREREILEALSRGAQAPPLTEAHLSDMIAASAVQRQTRKKTEDLDKELREIEKEAGMLPSDVLRSLSGAQAEQKEAEGALTRRDSAQASSHQQKALEHLERGQKGMQQALSQQQSIQQGSTQPFGRARGTVRPVGRGGGRSGTHRGFVPLPGAEEYQPPREIRREIEKSLRERRPRAFDETINEYLKRMSQ